MSKASSDAEVTRTLVIVSSVLSWAGTKVAPPAPPKQKLADSDDGGDDDAPAEEETDDRLTDDQEGMTKRDPHPAFTALRQFEKEVIATRRSNLKVYICCLGALYGEGESVFRTLFQVSLTVGCHYLIPDVGVGRMGAEKQSATASARRL